MWHPHHHLSTACAVLMCLAVCCSAGPFNYQRKNMPIKAREDTAPMADQQAQEMPEEPMPAAATAETEAAAAPPQMVGTLTLPSNATSIRADITDNFSCANKSYGYYADVENDCQIFHVCLPVTYADGKENTFRWSFICPEETIFNQESFTCMRPEDMTIECEDSARYYELNGNFGTSAEEESTADNQQAANNIADNEEAAMQSAAQPVPEPAPEKPKPMPVEKPMESEAPATTVPVKQQSKPVKVPKPRPKPNRRKPAVTYNRPATQPLRKMPTATAAPPLEAQEQTIQTSFAVEQEAQPAKPQRFSVRPSGISIKESVNKEKPQVIKVAVTHTRNELFNSNRKRPAVHNKSSPASTAKPVEQPEQEEETVTEAAVQVDLSEPQPTLKLQTMFAAKPEETVAPVATLDSIAEASEAAVAIAQPEEAEQTKAQVDVATDVEQPAPIPIEAIEEIPVVVVERVEQQAPEETEPVEDIKAETTEDKDPSLKQQLPVAPAIVEPSNSEEAGNNIEAFEAAKPADAPESMPATPEMQEPNPMVEAMLEHSDSYESKKESLGGFKPVDPVMAAEAEQLITDFINAMRKNEEKTETELATDAMNMAETIEDHVTEAPAAATVLKQANEANDAAEASEAADTAPAADEAVSIEEAKLPEPEIIEKDASIEEQSIEAEQSKEPQQSKLKLQDSPITNIVMLNQVPAEPHQIPVQVVDASASAAESAIKSEEAPAAALAVSNEPEENVGAAAYMPSISIDDIVELVKERLDQTPKGEQLVPMELVLTPGAAVPMTLIKSTNEPPKQEAEEQQPKQEVAQLIGQLEETQPEQTHSEQTQPEQTQPEQAQPEQEAEEVIEPIYKRVSAAEPHMSQVQTAPVTATKVETSEAGTQAEEAAAEVRQPKSTRVQNAPNRFADDKMDARKRRFLFRADAR